MDDQHSPYLNNPYNAQQNNQYPSAQDVNLLNMPPFTGSDRAQEASGFFPPSFPYEPYQPPYRMPENQPVGPDDDSFDYPTQYMNQDDVNLEVPSEKQLAFEKRREQNRQAQKKFRKKKETNIKQLEEKLAALMKNYKDLEGEHGDLKTRQETLEQEMQVLAEEKELLAEENRRLKTSIGSSPASTADGSWWQAGSESQFSQYHGSGRGSTPSMSPTARSRGPSG